MDTFRKVRETATEATANGGRVWTCRTWTFNSLPWGEIYQALRYHGVPGYLRRTVQGYLKEGCIGTSQDPARGKQEWSVLGPLLWDMAYSAVLRTYKSQRAIGYADGVLVLGTGRTWLEARRVAETCVACIDRAIRRLDLRTCDGKTEVIWLGVGDRERSTEKKMEIRVGKESVRVGNYIPYLGLEVDSRWRMPPFLPAGSTTERHDGGAGKSDAEPERAGRRTEKACIPRW